MQSKTLLIALALLSAVFIGFVFWVYFSSAGGLPLIVVVLACLLPLLVAASVWGLRRISARRASKGLEQALADDGARERRAAPEARGAELDRLRSEFERAVKALKTSKLAQGSRRGSEALYRLPWYTIIGPPASGKTTVLRNSGLKFPYLPGTGDRLKGIGGTRNCDWWLTNHAILLDTAGRWSIEESERDEWLAFLDLLKKHRGDRPLNGIIAAISIAGDDATSISAAAEDDLKDIALRMRERLDEITGRLGVALPVYLMFTKCDLIHGFVETFSNLSGERRKQIWGFTAPVLTGARRDPGNYFAQQFDLLREELEQRSVVRMAEEVDPNLIPLIYEFPAQFGALKDKLTFFVDELFDSSAYRETPLLRGAYFTSGTQEGAPADLLFEEMANALNLRPQVYESREEEKKSYFLHDMLMRVVFEDRSLATASTVELGRQQWKRRLTTSSLFASALVGTALSIDACQHNLSVLQSTQDALSASEAARQRAEGSAVGVRPEPVVELVTLEREVPRHAMGSRGLRDLGLYEGERITPPLRRYYHDALTRAVVRPLLQQNHATLLARTRELQLSAGARRSQSLDEGARNELFDALSLHLLLTGPHESCTPRPLARKEFLVEQLLALWQRAEPGDDAQGDERKQLLQRYVELADHASAVAAPMSVERDERGVTEARRALGEDDRVGRLLARVLAKYAETPQTLSTLVGPSAAIQGSASLGGAFNLEAWAQISRGIGASDFSETDGDWVFGCSGTENDSARAERDSQAFQKAYLKRYAVSWHEFLSGLAGRAPKDGAEAEAMLGELVNRSGVLGALFASVLENTALALPRDTLVAEATADKLQKAEVALEVGAALSTGALRRVSTRGLRALNAAERVVPKGSSTEGADAGPEYVEPLHEQFADFASFEQGGGGSSGLDQYRRLLEPVLVALKGYRADESQVDTLASATQSALDNTDLLIRNHGGKWSAQLSSVLVPVLSGVLDLVRVGRGNQLARGYCDAVYAPFQRELAGRFPLAPESTDPANLAAFARFFQPGSGTLWEFQKTHLAGSVSSQGGRFRFTGAQARSVYRDELLGFLQRAQAISDAFFPEGGGGPRMSFRLRVRGAPGYSLTTFRAGSRTVQYDSGAESWVSMEWPGDAASAGAALSVTPYQGPSPRPLQFDNPWGLFMILEPRVGAQLFERGKSTKSVGWRPRGSLNFVKVDFASDDPRSPLMAAPFSSGGKLFPLHVPSRISRVGAACSMSGR
jgi:type VI secretion system protein ImpL